MCLCLACCWLPHAPCPAHSRRRQAGHLTAKASLWRVTPGTCVDDADTLCHDGQTTKRSPALPTPFQAQQTFVCPPRAAMHLRVGLRIHSLAGVWLRQDGTLQRLLAALAQRMDAVVLAQTLCYNGCQRA